MGIGQTRGSGTELFYSLAGQVSFLIPNFTGHERLLRTIEVALCG